MQVLEAAYTGNFDAAPLRFGEAISNRVEKAGCQYYTLDLTQRHIDKVRQLSTSHADLSHIAMHPIAACSAHKYVAEGGRSAVEQKSFRVLWLSCELKCHRGL